MQTIIDLSSLSACDEAMFEEEVTAFWRRLGVPEQVLSMPLPMISRAVWCARLFLLEQKEADLLVLRGAERPVLCGLCGGFAPKALALVSAIADQFFRVASDTGQRVELYQEIPFFEGGAWRQASRISEETVRLASRALYQSFWDATAEKKREYLRHLTSSMFLNDKDASLYNITIAESFNALGYFCGLNVQSLLCEELTALYDLNAHQPRRPDELWQIGRTDSRFLQPRLPAKSEKSYLKR